MRKLSLAAVAAALAISPAAASAPDAESLIKARQASLALSAATFGSIGPAVDAGVELKTQTFAARALARWAKALPTLFPAGTDTAPSRAKPEVWTDRAGFERAAADYQAATEKLLALTEGQDREAFKAQLAEVRAACQACHTGYRQPAPR